MKKFDNLSSELGITRSDGHEFNFLNIHFLFPSKKLSK